jgi:uncharacterized membrane protein YphA (DoxX/SURF4 family)
LTEREAYSRPARPDGVASPTIRPPARTTSERRGISGWPDRLRAAWASDRQGVSIEVLRVGMGVIWLLNLVFVLVPANQFFSTFRAVAISFAPTSLNGPGVADFVAAHAAVFAGVTAAVTAYLSVAFLLGFTTRLACLVGAGASLLFLLTQFASTFETPGGTDVGPHPLYLLIYLILFVGRAGRYLSLDRRLAAGRPARYPRLSRWLSSPAE